MNFAERLKELRLARHLMQKELAEQVGISPSSISMYEAGNRVPAFEQEEILADFFNVDIDYLRGKKDSTTEIVTADIHVLIQLYKRMTPRQRELVTSYARGILDWDQAIEEESKKTSMLGEQLTIL